MNAIFRYPGAKWAIAEWIVRHLPPAPRYVEPFCGSAAVFFHLAYRPEYAVLNDLSGEVVNVFQVLREQPDALLAALELTPWARAEWATSIEPAADPVERARRYLVHLWQAHGISTPTRPSGWSTVAQRNARCRVWRSLPDRLAARG